MPPMLAGVSHRSDAKETASLLPKSSAEQAEDLQIGKPRLFAGPSVCAITPTASDGTVASTLSELRRTYQISRKKINGAAMDRALGQRGEQKIAGKRSGCATIEDGYEGR